MTSPHTPNFESDVDLANTNSDGDSILILMKILMIWVTWIRSCFKLDNLTPKVS